MTTAATPPSQETTHAGAPGLSLPPDVAASRCYTWATQLRRHAHEIPDRVALRHDGTSVSWRRLDAEVDRLAATLSQAGVESGDRVTLWLDNIAGNVRTLLAVARLGAIAVPAGIRLAPAEVGWIAENSGSRVVVAAAGSARLPGGAGELPLIDPDAAIDGDTAGEPAVADRATDPMSPALIVYTSGTTGRPKGAVLTHLNLLMQAITGVRTRQLVGDDEVMLVSTPLSHIAALGSLAAMLLVGGTSVLSRPGAFDPAEVVRLLEAEKVTAAFFVPTQWTAICQVPGLSSRSLSLRTIGWGASPAPPATLAAISEIFPGLPLVATFGQTEMSPVTCVLDGADAVRKAGSVGRAVPTVAVRILDEDMHDVPDGEVGEIVYRGAPTMAGYWDNPAATAEAFAGGWFHSGDLVRRDDEGFIYVVDRKKDMIISGGENIYSAELEQVIGKHPLVRDVAVIGVPHPRWVETPLAVIEPADPGRPPMLDDIAAWCQQRLASYKKPTRLEIVDQLPRNPNGKTDKPALRARLAAG